VPCPVDLGPRQTNSACVTRCLGLQFNPLLVQLGIEGNLVEHLNAKDGTRIGFKRSGTGPALVLVHGTSASHTRWAPILPELERHFSIYAIDRRGRGESGDASAYAIDLEFDDVATVVDAIDESVFLLGHSYGGICALEASLLTNNVGKLVLYEPPIPIEGEPIYPEGVIERLQTQLDADDREGVVRTFFTEVVRMPPHEFELFRASPAWPARVAAAHTLPRELRAHEAYRLDAARFKHLSIPTLLLLGGDSPSFFKASIEALAAALPNSQVVVMPGQQHIAIDTAPKLFVGEVVRFLKG
jgi:pimeloyl-ACP methyl ester carboxylesterase